MECDGALQGIPSFCGEDGQQSFDVHPYYSQLGCHWAQVDWHTGLILVCLGIPERGRQWNSRVPISHDHATVHSLLEGAIIGAADWSEAEANEALLCEHVQLEDEVRVQAAKLAPMHVVNWEDA